MKDLGPLSYYFLSLEISFTFDGYYLTSAKHIIYLLFSANLTDTN
jgi:hypothetical protein